MNSLYAGKVAVAKGNTALAPEGAKLKLTDGTPMKVESVMSPSAVPGQEPKFVGEGGWGFEIPTRAKNKDTAIEFCKWMATREGQVIYAQIYGGVVPSTSAVLDDAIYQGDTLVKLSRRRAIASLKNTVYYGNDWGLDRTGVDDPFTKVRQGVMTAAEAAKALQQVLTDNFKKWKDSTGGPKVFLKRSHRTRAAGAVALQIWCSTRYQYCQEIAMTTRTALSSIAPEPRRNVGAAVTKTLHRPQFWFGLIVLVPILVWYAWFSFGPMLRAFWMATVRYNLMDPGSSPFIGLKNFQQVFSYPLFWTSVRQTIYFSITVYLGTLPLAVFVSMCLVSVARGRGFYQFVLYLPVVVSYVAIALLFRMLMDPQTGQFNQILAALGLPTSKWITGVNSALPSIAMIDVWKGLGFHVVIITAGLLGIPEEMYDAAKVDGANAWHRFRFVTFPLLGNTLLLESVIMVMGTLQAFTNGEVLGCAGNSCFWISRLVYSEAFTNMRFGFATAAAFVLFVFILGLTLIQIKVLRPTWSY